MSACKIVEQPLGPPGWRLLAQTALKLLAHASGECGIHRGAREDVIGILRVAVPVLARGRPRVTRASALREDERRVVEVDQRPLGRRKQAHGPGPELTACLLARSASGRDQHSLPRVVVLHDRTLDAVLLEEPAPL